jgi:hypothetical protein
VLCLDGCDGRVEPFDGYSGAVGDNLGHDVADFVAVKPHGHDGVSAAGASFPPHPLTCLVAAVGEQLCVAGDLTARRGPKRGAEITEVVSGAL